MLADSLKSDGHTVAFSAFSGLSGADIKWHGYQVMPAGELQFGLDMLLPHARRFNAELIITLMDSYKLTSLGRELTSVCPVLCWTPVDTVPLSKRDEDMFRTTMATPIAMSHFGASELAAVSEAGNVQYAPHVVDTGEYFPMGDRDTFREELGVTGKFVVGICAANKDHMRKGFPEQFRAFSLFLRKHPESVLLVHSVYDCHGGMNLGQLATDMGIADHIMFSEPYVQKSGLFSTDMMRRWYNALDVLSLCSYGEGFGVPLIEAQACGTPVITTDASAMSELAPPPNTLVGGELFWNPVHQAYWTRPNIDQIVKAYSFYHNLASDEAQRRRAVVREWSLRFDVDKVFFQYWKPIIDSVGKAAADAGTTAV
jgi:glycosyltransferase involved in cell wall biosynthesis